MESDAVRIADISRNRLIDTLGPRFPVWKSLLTLLRPMDILALVRATFFCVSLTGQELQVYMKWWRQVFYTIAFVEHNPSKIIVFGKDIFRLKSTLKRWEYFDVTKMRLLIIVDESVDEEWTVVWKRRREVFQSVSTPFVWDIDLSRISGRLLVEASVLFFTKYGAVSFELDALQSNDLLDRSGTFSSIINRVAYPDWGLEYKVWFVNLHYPDSLTQQTSTSAHFALSVFIY